MNTTLIPLFAMAVISIIVFLLLIGIAKKKTARVSFITFFADIVVFASSVYSIFLYLKEEGDPVRIFMLGISIAALLFVPYCIMLCTFEPKKIVKLVPHAVNEAADKALAEQNAALRAQKNSLETSEKGSHALQVSYSFTKKAAEAYASEDGMVVLLDFINKTIRDEIKADGGAFLMVDEYEDVVTVKSFEGDFPPPYKLPNDMPHKPIRIATNFKFASFPLRDNIFGEVATMGKAELITKPEKDPRIFQNGPEEFLECGSYIFVPMKIQDSVIGVAAFARTKKNEVFTEEDLKTVTTLIDFASVSVKSVISVKEIMEHNSLIQEAQITTGIQEMLHPAKLPNLPGMQMASIWQPVEGVCGDYYDVIPSRKDRISFVMSDVAGKSINSIIVMAMIRANLHLVVNTKKSAGTILEWVNHGIAGESFSTDHFASCALINYDPTTKKAEIASGGTTPVYYYNAASNTIKLMTEASEPIGVDKESKYKDILQNIESGDILLTYSDGLVESLNEAGNQYPKQKMLDIVVNNAKASSKDIVNKIKADVKSFLGNSSQHDDQSLLLIKF